MASALQVIPLAATHTAACSDQARLSLFGASRTGRLICAGPQVAACLELDNVLPGFDDAGAHGTILTDATAATSTLAHYGRDRAALGLGRNVRLEQLVKVQTADAAALFGLDDRGVLAPGYRADINVIDIGSLRVEPPQWANDLPTNAGRWVQAVRGYIMTVLRGVVTFEAGEHTGALPGRLVRNPQAVGIVNGGPGAEAATVGAPADSVDLTKYAVELSRGGGASAVARVLRDEDAKAKL